MVSELCFRSLSLLLIKAWAIDHISAYNFLEVLDGRSQEDSLPPEMCSNLLLSLVSFLAPFKICSCISMW